MKYIFIIVFVWSQVFAQIGLKKSFQINTEPSSTNNAFLGNGIVDIIINGDEIWAATGYGLNKSSDAGLTWQTFDSYAYGSKGGISALGVMDKSTIWIASAFDTSARGEDLPAGSGLSYTQDGGNSWRHISQPLDDWRLQKTYISTSLNDVFFIDDKTGWAVGDSGIIVKTLNKGITWELQQINTLFNLHSIQFIGENGWVVGDFGTILYTGNSGNSWNAQSLSSTQNIFSVFFLDQDNGWVTGENGLLFKTNNGGQSWQPAELGSTIDIKDIFFINALKGWLVGSEGAIYQTEDGGENWAFLNSGVSTTLNSVFLTSANSGLIVGDQGVILRTTDSGINWDISTPDRDINLHKVFVNDDKYIWIAGEKGTIYFSKDNGLSWKKRRNTFVKSLHSIFFTKYQGWAVGDDGIILRATNVPSPTLTPIQNITYDIAFVDSTIWIASWGGGFRRSNDMGNTWDVITSDSIAFSSGDNLNHLGFSLLSENGNIWFGSAEGISKSTDNGKTWKPFKHESTLDYSISGNWIIAIDYQEETNTIWAATRTTESESGDTTEFNAVNKSVNGGLSWEVMLEDNWVHNFGFDGKTVFAAADEGLFVSEDGGNNWYLLPPVVDSQNGEEVLEQEYYSAAGQNSRWWFGSSDGLVTTNDKGNTWQIIRSFVSTRQRTSPKVYAYPTAFSPSRGSYTRFQYDISGETDVEIKIYNFAMEQVVTIRETEINFNASSADRSTKWDGRDVSGKLVASGVYFFRAKIGNKVEWGKIVVIN